MRNSEQQFLSPVEAVPFVIDSTQNNPLTVISHSEQESVHAIDLIEAAVAIRLNCFDIDPNTQKRMARIARATVWSSVVRTYEKACYTGPKDFYADVAPQSDSSVNIGYTLPLAANGRSRTAVKATYNYFPVSQKTKNGIIHTLRRHKLGRVTLGLNGYFEEAEKAETTNAPIFDSNRIFRNAQANGRAGGYRY